MYKKLIFSVLLLCFTAANADCSRFSKAMDARYDTIINNGEYSFNVVVRTGNDVCTPVSSDRKTGISVWESFTPSLVTQSVSTLEDLNFESDLCRTFVVQEDTWIRTVYRNIRKIIAYDAEIAFSVANANRSGKLKRHILCAPKMYDFNMP